MRDGLTTYGLSIACATCATDLDFVDEFAEVGICRQCGVAFLVEHRSAKQEVQTAVEGRV